jgi:drug/metabolite transporter (DMT)-like permease
MKILHSLRTGLWGQAYVLLSLTALMWGGNAIAGRLAVGEISPMVLTCLRWVFVVGVMIPLVGRQVVAEWAKIRARWIFTILMGAFGFTAFNGLFYAAAHHTTAVNLTIFQGAIPVLVLLGTVLFFGARVIPLQVLGMIVTILGVVLVSVKADMEILRTLSLNIGDVWMLIACLFYAGYTLGLRHRPAIRGWCSSPPWRRWPSSAPCPSSGWRSRGARRSFPRPRAGSSCSTWRSCRPCCRSSSSSAAWS